MVVWYYLDVGCVLRNLTGMPCPTCRASRAILSLLTFNIKDYFYYHPMALPIALALFLTVRITAFPSKYRKFIIVYLVAAVVLTLILYFYRLLNGLIL